MHNYPNQYILSAILVVTITLIPYAYAEPQVSGEPTSFHMSKYPDFKLEGNYDKG